MSQEYTEDKEVTLTRLSSGRRLLEALLIIVTLFALWLMAALVSFNPSDPSWSQTAWHEPIHNLGGGPGAWLADTLFFIFGVMAYTLPVIILGACWFAWRYRRENDYIDYFAVALRLIGVLALVITSCGLAAMNADDIWYFASGGVIGSLLNTAMTPMLNNSGGTIALLCVWAAGLTLFTGWSWVTIAEKTGGLILNILTFASNRTRPHRDDSWVDEEYDQYDHDQPASERQPVRESRRSRILRGSLARRRRLADKFANPLGRRPDAALFSGQRMDDSVADVSTISVQDVPVDSDDVLFSGRNATGDTTLEYDPLFDAPPATAVSASWQPEFVAPVAGRPAPDHAPDPNQRASERQTASTVSQGGAGVAPSIQPWQTQVAQPPERLQDQNSPAQPQPYPESEAVYDDNSGHSYHHVQSGQPYVQPASYREMTAYEPPESPVAEFGYSSSTASDNRPYDEPQASCQLTEHSAHLQAAESLEAQPEVPTEPARHERPPLYYFEEVEARRAREREQLAAWYQPIPEPPAQSQPILKPAPHTEPLSESVTDSLSETVLAATVSAATDESGIMASKTAAAGALFIPVTAANAPRSQVKEGIGPQLPRPNRVRVPTRRELASYGIKLPSQREAERRQSVEDLTDDEQLDEFQQDELARQFAAVQQQRYGEKYGGETEGDADNDAEVASQAELARQFADSQRQRYGADIDKRDDVQCASLSQPATPLAPAGYPQSAAAHEPFQSVQVNHSQRHVMPGQSVPQQSLSANTPTDHLQPVGPDSTVSQGYAPQPQRQHYDSQPQHPGQAALQSDSLPSTDSYSGQPPQGYVPQPQRQHYGSQPQHPNQTALQASQPHQGQSYDAQPVASRPAGPYEQASVPKETLLHPLLMRNGDSRPLQKPTTPLPSLDLLASPPAEVEPVDTFALEQMARLVEVRLSDFRIKADVVNYSPGPVITRFELNLAPGVKAARISNLSRDLARSLSTVAVRVVEVIPGKPYVGLELPNKKRQTVYLREVLDCHRFREMGSPLTIVLGKDIAGDPVVADLQKMPHLLVAGTTGSGKSVGVNAMILSMLYKATPEEVRFIMIDPKMLELSVYEGIPHLLTEVVTDMKDAANALRWCVNEMERRYKLMSALGVRNLAGYNEKILEAEHMRRPIPDPYWKPGDSMDATHPVLKKEPYIVVIVDEFADLMMTVGKKVEELIARLAQKARAAGIHLVLATQRPSVDVITGLIKANIPTRIAFTVSSKIDSRTILDQGGAESLLGMGDMLYMAPNSSTPVRVHGAFVRDQEVHSVVQDWKARGRPQYIEGITSDNSGEGGSGAGMDGDEELDALFDQAVSFVVEKRKASISGVQRQFRIGYNRAARIIEQMEAQGIVSAPGHNGNREVLAPPPFE